MLSTADISDLSKKRTWVLACSMTVGVVGMLICLAVAGYWRETFQTFVEQAVGNTATTFMPFSLILLSLAVFLVPMIWGDRRSKQYSIICPNCSTDVSRFTRRILTTRCCYYCGKQIVEGERTHGPAAFERFSRMQQRRFLKYWFWTWPVLGSFVLAYHWYAPSALDNCPHMLFVPGLIGTIATSWAFVRTEDKRYLPQWFAAVIILCLGVTAFW